MKRGRLLRLILFIAAFSLCTNNEIVSNKNPLQNQVYGRWVRYASCSVFGTESRFSYWFKPDTFKFFGSSLCVDSSTEFISSCEGNWQIHNDSIQLISNLTSGHYTIQSLLSISLNGDTLFLNAVKYVRLPQCYIVYGFCDGMQYVGKLGNNFSEAIDSLLKMQPGYKPNELSFNTERLLSVKDTSWQNYFIPAYEICIYKDSIWNMIHACGDVIDSLGNWFILEFCPD